MKYRGSEILVGAFVLAGLFVIIGGIFTIRGLGWGGLVEYHARYRNAGGIEVGTPVKFNGVLRGRVRAITIDQANPQLVRVEFVVRPGTPVTTRSIAKITRADLLGDPYVDLRFADAPAGTAAGLAAVGEPLPPGGEVTAGDAFDLQATLDNAQAAIQSLAELASSLQDQLDSVVKSTQRLLDSAEGLLSAENRETVTRALAHAEDALRGVDELIEGNRARVDSLITHADQTTVELADLSKKLGGAVDDLLPKVTALLDDTRDSLGQAREALQTANDTMKGLDMQQVADIVENLNSASRNLSDLSRDLKSRPYKLLRSEKPEPPRFPLGSPAPAPAGTP